MRIELVRWLACCLWLLPACTTSRSHAELSPAQTVAAPQTSSAEKSGVFTPTVFTAISIWPRAFEGNLLALEVAPHGATVAQGDVLAQLDTRAIDDQVHDAELEAKSAEVRHQATLDRNIVDEEAARSALDTARANLDRAQRALAGYKASELAFAKRADELRKKNEEANVEDQQDEMRELRKMYDADELVDATENIVLKRAERQLAVTLAANELSRDRARYQVELEQALELERREETVREQKNALSRLMRSQDIERRTRQDAQVRSADALARQQQKLERLRADRELYTLRAPRAGVLLHGSADSYRPGSTTPRHARGGQLAARTDLFLVADPHPSAIALEVDDAELARFTSGHGARVKSLAPQGASARGTIDVDTYPRKIEATKAVFGVVVELEQPLEGALYGTRALVTLDGEP